MPYLLALSLVLSGVYDDDGATAPPLLEASGPRDGGRAAPPPPVTETEDGECVTDEGLPAPCVEETVEPEQPTKKKKRTTRRRRVKKELPDVRFVANGAVLGGVALNANVAGEIGVSASAGALFKSGIGIVGLAHVHLNPNATRVNQRYGLGVGARFGSKSFLTVGLSPTIAVDAAGVRFGGTVLTQVFVLISSRVGVMLQPAIHFDASGVLFSATLGVGVSF
ncbi:MAG: hypothetical protein ACO1OB_07055 [Archangium sp.]